jgi:hypothetical protein
MSKITEGPVLRSVFRQVRELKIQRKIQAVLYVNIYIYIYKPWFSKIKELGSDM